MNLLLAVLLTAPDPTLVDVAKIRESMVAYGDNAGHVLVVAVPNYEAEGGGSDPVAFYGDGKTMYELAIFAGLRSGDEAEATFLDQRHFASKQSKVLTDDSWKSTKVRCGEHTTTLKRLADDKALIAKAVFKRTPNDTTAYIIGRDDRGTYYFVDRGRFKDNEQMYRVFTGPRGALKQQKLKNIVHDSGGDIFATSNGDLRLVSGEQPAWIKGSARTPLKILQVEENVEMIYNDLGVYKGLRLGTPCDDL